MGGMQELNEFLLLFELADIEKMSFTDQVTMIAAFEQFVSTTKPILAKYAAMNPALMQAITEMDSR